jgi:hypothetical protein
MLAHRLTAVEGLEAVTEDAEMRRIVLHLSSMSRRGAVPDFLCAVARDRELDDETKSQLAELASDQAFLLAVEEHLRSPTGSIGRATLPPLAGD